MLNLKFENDDELRARIIWNIWHPIKLPPKDKCKVWSVWTEFRIHGQTKIQIALEVFKQWKLKTNLKSDLLKKTTSEM